MIPVVTRRLALVVLVTTALAGCGGSGDSAKAEAAVRSQYPNRDVTCSQSDLEYGGDNAYSCTVGKRRICVALLDGEVLELWDERPLRPGEPGFDPNASATVRDGPSC